MLIKNNIYSPFANIYNLSHYLFYLFHKPPLITIPIRQMNQRHILNFRQMRMLSSNN